MAHSKRQMNLIKDYYAEMNTNVVFINSILDSWKIFHGVNHDNIIISNFKWIRGIAALLKMRRFSLDKVKVLSEQYFAMKDALLLLSKKHVPVYYINRVGLEKNGFEYSDSAKNRMKKRLNFPTLYEHMDEYEADLKEIFAELYNKDYVKEIGKIPQVIKKGDSYRHEDYASKYVNVIEGKRIVCNQPKNTTKTLHIYGRCGVFGYAVEDKNSLPSLIQLYLSNHGINDMKIVNHGLWGGDDTILDYNFLNDCVGFKEGDIVMFYRRHIDKRLLKHFEECGVKYKEITHEWHQYPEATWCFYDKPGHMNHIGYRNAAEIISKYLISDGFQCATVNDKMFENFKSEHLNDYLKANNKSEFNKEIAQYTDSILTEYPLSPDMNTCGAIVMNCNPFTKGHRFLIEYAAERVDRLYIFVVQEDKSFFKYEDRFEMVKNGTSDLKNVVVVSSGKFIISSLTFPEYFMKDYVKEKNFDVSMDVETFCKHIAPPLHIKKRFAGEEPFDPVTLNYNENMRTILPKYGMEFCEIPRLAIDNSRVINATEVRRLLKERNFDAIKDYVPNSTLEILKAKY